MQPFGLTCGEVVDGRMGEMAGKWHIVERWISVDGETLKFLQDRDVCVISDVNNAPYARLSVRLPGSKAPDGWFWVKTWGENEDFWRKVSYQFEVRDDIVMPVSDYVSTKLARLLPATPQGMGNHDRTDE
jgi:hypothetical protein